MEKNTTVSRLQEFLSKGTSPYHVVANSESMLLEDGFKALSLDAKWEIEPRGKYYVNAFGSTIFAFTVGEHVREHLRIAAAHTDFPNLRIKPSADLNRQGYVSLNIETYGGLLLHTWVDRPLSIAGKVVVKGDSIFSPKAMLVDFKRPLVTIPNLAIHMDRSQNDGFSLNRQNHMLPLAAREEQYVENQLKEALEYMDFLSVLAREVGVLKEDILFYDLGVYPTDAGCTLGFQNEFFSASRLDNLTSVKACLAGILADAELRGLHVIALFDNEEVGSRTKQGADSLLLSIVLERIYMALGYTTEECYEDMLGGFMISADVAHGYHPNYSEKNDLTNKPVLGKGLAIKYACSQKYAGDAEAVSVIKGLCEAHHIPYQMYVNRADIVGGGTLGSIASSIVPMRTMDVGVPLLAMHSARELMGTRDQEALEDLIIQFFKER